MIKELKEKGTYDKIAANYEPQPQICPDMSGQPLGFDSCITLFLIILAGLSACICLLVTECFLHYLFPEITWFISSIPPETQMSYEHSDSLKTPTQSDTYI
jgi:hypothetical protein